MRNGEVLHSFGRENKKTHQKIIQNRANIIRSRERMTGFFDFGEGRYKKNALNILMGWLKSHFLFKW